MIENVVVTREVLAHTIHQLRGQIPQAVSLDSSAFLAEEEVYGG
jgi:hypothetical protein